MIAFYKCNPTSNDYDILIDGVVNLTSNLKFRSSLTDNYKCVHLYGIMDGVDSTDGVNEILTKDGFYVHTLDEIQSIEECVELFISDSDMLHGELFQIRGREGIQGGRLEQREKTGVETQG